MPASNTPMVLGATREMFFAALGQSAPQQSFLEAQEGTTVTSAQISRDVRLGDPINTGPNSYWHQLTWQGGALQDIWADNQMYSKGNVDVLTWPGKAKMWPGFLSYWKKDNLPNCHGFAMSQSGRAASVTDYQNFDISQCSLNVGEREHLVGDPQAAVYQLFQINPGFQRGDGRTLTHLMTSRDGPWRIVMPAMADDYAAGVSICCSNTKMYILYESQIAGNVRDNTLVQDTNAPLTTSAGYQFHNDTGCSFVDGFYYGHGNRLYKRVPKPPFGVLGTHTLVHAIKSAKYIQGMTVWNNRIWFGVAYPNGTFSLFTSDGATTVKAIDFPAAFVPHQMTVVAGQLYITGYQPSGVLVAADLTKKNIVSQVWRFDGVSLKKLWQEGHMEDGARHLPSPIIEWNGYAVWASQGTNSSDNQTGVYDEGFACLMFYDPVNDAIVPGPGLNVHGSNTSHHLWITGLARWNSTIAVGFRNSTGVGSSMVVAMRQDNQTRHDLRWPVNGSDVQFQSPDTTDRALELFTSEYHGPDDVINEKKTWLAVRTRVRFTGSSNNASLKIYYRSGVEAGEGTGTLLGTITPNGTGSWEDHVTLVKSGSAYLTSKKIQLRFVFSNTDNSSAVDSTAQVWLDDVSVSYFLAPVKQRQWQLRIPVSEAQANLHGGNNGLTTVTAMLTQLESYAFGNAPVLWWPPRSDGTLPSDTSQAIEVHITGYQSHVSRLESSNDAAGSPTGQFGYVSLTIVENEPAV